MISIPSISVIPRSWIIIAVVVLVAGVVANTYRLSAAVDREHADLVQCQSDKRTLEENVATLTLAVDEQNLAIEAWRSVADRAAASAETANAAVDRLVASRQKIQADLEVWTRRAGEDECSATRRLLLEYPR